MLKKKNEIEASEEVKRMNELLERAEAWQKASKSMHKSSDVENELICIQKLVDIMGEFVDVYDSVCEEAKEKRNKNEESCD